MGRAIVRNPQVFLFDEPLSNLDAKLRVQMRSEIKALHQRLKVTTVYVTHDQIEAMTMADKIVVMNTGVIEQAGPPLDLYDRPANIFVAGFIGSPAMNVLDGQIVDGHFQAKDGMQWALPEHGRSAPVGARSSTASGPEHLRLDPAGHAGQACSAGGADGLRDAGAAARRRAAHHRRFPRAHHGAARRDCCASPPIPRHIHLFDQATGLRL